MLLEDQHQSTAAVASLISSPILPADRQLVSHTQGGNGKQDQGNFAPSLLSLQTQQPSHPAPSEGPSQLDPLKHLNAEPAS